MGDRDRTRACSLHCGSLHALRCETLMFFFLPCDTQTRDHLDEADLRGRVRKYVSARSQRRVALARELASDGYAGRYGCQSARLAAARACRGPYGRVRRRAGAVMRP